MRRDDLPNLAQWILATFFTGFEKIGYVRHQTTGHQGTKSKLSEAACRAAKKRRNQARKRQRKLAAFAILILSSAQPAQAQLFRRLFGGRQQQQCAPVQQAYYQPVQYAAAVQYQVVAAVPLTTIPLAVDLQSYVYSVNAAAFQNFREYQTQKNQQGQEAAPVGQPSRASQISQTVVGAEILKRSCIQCHQTGRNPKAGFAIFDESGELAQNLPYQEMLSRMTSDESPMPPRGQLPNRDILAVMRWATDGAVPARPVQTVAADQPASPF
jgi:mono/diheme cytochrome c family protein